MECRLLDSLAAPMLMLAEKTACCLAAEGLGNFLVAARINQMQVPEVELLYYLWLLSAHAK